MDATAEFKLTGTDSRWLARSYGPLILEPMPAFAPQPHLSLA